MRVLMLSDVYFPRINGVSTSIQTFRDALRPLGVEVTLVAPDYPGAVPDPDIIRLPSRAVPFDPEDRLMHWSALRALERRPARADFQLVHVQTPFAAHYAGLRLARRFGLPCVATYHTHFEEYLFHYLPLLPRGLLRATARAIARRQCNALDGVIVPSQAMAEALRGYGVSAPLSVIPTGMPETQFHPGDGPAFRARHGIPADALVALYVGRAAHEKNIGFLLEAAAIARRRLPRLLLLVAGEGPALPALRRQAEELDLGHHVSFVGYLDRDTALRDCYAAADVFAFASLTETQGLVILEAMAAGLPVLALSAMGTRGLVDPERGAQRAAADPHGLAAQLVTLLSQPDRRAAMSVAGREFAHEWTAERPAAELAAFYRGHGQPEFDTAPATACRAT